MNTDPIPLADCITELRAQLERLRNGDAEDK